MLFFLCPFHLPNLGVQSRRVEDQGPHTFLIDKSDFVKEPYVSLGPVYTMDHEVGPWKMAFFHGPTSIIRFLKKSIYKAFGPLTRCKPNGDKEEWPCTKKWMWYFFQYMLKNWQLFIQIQLWPFSCLHNLFPKKFSAMNPCLFLLQHMFCLSHRKTHWTTSMDNVGLKIHHLVTLNSMVTLTFVPWCKPKWSRDEFNNQSQILHGLGTTSWSVV